jgi:hypothetical protein
VSAHLYIEGSKTGKNSKFDQIRCREGFRKLIEKAGFTGRMPGLDACGSRGQAFKDFKIAHVKGGAGGYVAMLVDSEEPPADIEKTWEHLKDCDTWEKPPGAMDDQVLFMTTCTETWVVADRAALEEHYGHKLQENALPSLYNLEARNRHDVQDKLSHATRNCSNAYAKGDRSFEVLGMLEPSTLRALPSFARMVRILDAKL